MAPVNFGADQKSEALSSILPVRTLEHRHHDLPEAWGDLGVFKVSFGRHPCLIEHEKENPRA